MTSDFKTLHQTHKGKITDKWQQYLSSYDAILSPYKNQKINLLEIGVQNGGSLEIWSKYFVDAQHIIGCDINPQCGDLVFDDSRIRVFVGDASQEETHQTILETSMSFDIIIDDGSHTSRDIIHNFALYFNNLRDGGVYIIEDLHCSYWQEFGGGLYHPYSAMAFLKSLVDVIHYEHWGLALDNHAVLREFYQYYGSDFSVDLSHIHSVEFINSICVIKKQPPTDNELGVRCVSGEVGLIFSKDNYPNRQKNKAVDQNSSPYKISQTVTIENLKKELSGVSAEILNQQQMIRIFQSDMNISQFALEEKSSLMVSLSDQLQNLNREFDYILSAVKKNQARLEDLSHIQKSRVQDLEVQNRTIEASLNATHQLSHMQAKRYQKYKSLWVVKLVKPLIKLEQGISSANVYRKGFYNLIKEKGSIGKAYQYLRRMRKMNPNEDKPVKRYLRTLVAQRKTGSVVPWHVPAFFDIADTKAYQSWIQRNDTRTEDDFKRMQHEIGAFLHQPLVSILMPVYNVDSKWLILAIDSVRDQVYENWELCISDDASPNPDIRSVLEKYMQLDERIKVVFREGNGHISENSNSALALASGEWLALMDHDDVLPNHALYEVVKAIHKSPDAALIYSDEDKIDEKGRRFMPHFKSDFNLDLLYGQNYISHLGVYRTDIAKAIGGFRKGLEGSQDYDFLLRYLLKIDPSQIIHIPKVLYHWRAIEGSTALSSGEKSYTTEAGVKALQNYFAQLHADVSVGRGKADNLYRVQWNLTYEPLVSLIIPTKNGYEVTKQAIDSILNKTTYAHYEILLVDNNSDDPKALAYFDELSQHEKITVLRYPHPFDYSAINNFAVQHARGEVIGLINNDVEVIDGGWLTEMVSQAMRPDIGCVGAMLYYPNDTIQHAGVVIGINGVAGHSHKHYPKSHPGYFSRLFVAQDLLAVTAACLLLRKTTFDEVGGLNERDLTVAFNDVDLCLKVHKAGYRNLWTPYAELYHHESISRGREDNPEKIARFKREVDYMLNTWHTNTLFDPYYNPNLTIEREDFSISMLSRVDTSS